MTTQCSHSEITGNVDDGYTCTGCGLKWAYKQDLPPPFNEGLTPRPPPTSMPSAGLGDPIDRRRHGRGRRKSDTAIKGRKFWMTVGTLGAPFLSCTIGFFMGRMSPETYVSFLQLTIPIGLAAFHAANVAQKVGLAKAGADPNA